MRCIFCDSENVKLVRTLKIPPSWSRNSTIFINLYQCLDCGRKFRKKREELEELAEALVEET